MIAITYSCGHTGTIAAPNDGGGACHAPSPCPGCERPETVRTLDIFGETHDTGRTESQLNGWTIAGPAAESKKVIKTCQCSHLRNQHPYDAYCRRCDCLRFRAVYTEPMFGGPLL